MAITWNETNAAHLYRRAGFGGTAAEIDRAVREGLTATVDRLLDYEQIPNTDLDQRLNAAALDLSTPGGIIRWWIIRLFHSARPLEERMTFFLHDHFATAISKVNDASFMLRQNRLLRKYATGNFINLTIDISKDPAMLIWLDNWTSRKEHPNENYGRELLELFTLGIGNYSELDVMSAAKAFTGWSLQRRTGDFVFIDQWHDYSQKDFLGRVGNWNGDDIVRIACGEFAHGRLMASKLFSLFAYPNPEQSVVDRFAKIYLDAGTELKPLLRAILTSDEMYSTAALWSRVKSPVDYLATAIRQLQVSEDLSRAATGPLNAQGQVPFNPPDVDGWITGLEWMNSGTLLSRMNFAQLVTSRFDPMSFTAGTTFSGASQLVDYYLRRLGPLVVSSATRQRLVSYVSPTGALPSGSEYTIKQRGLAHMILSLPEWQMY